MLVNVLVRAHFVRVCLEMWFWCAFGTRPFVVGQGRSRAERSTLEVAWVEEGEMSVKIQSVGVAPEESRGLFGLFEGG